MHLKLMLGAAGLAMMLAAAGCNQTTEEAVTPTEEPTPAPSPETDIPPEFQRTAIYDCGGQEIRVIFEHGDPRKVRIRLADGKILDLPAQANAIEMAYTDGTNSFVSPGGIDMVLSLAGAEGKPCSAVTRSLPPPAISGAVRDIKAEDAGKTFEVNKGEKFSVSLSGVPTAGYVWGVEKLPAFLTKKEETGGATSTAQFQPGFAGGNHWEVIAFEATAAGEGELELAQRRPWENQAAPDDQRFKVTIKVK